MGRGLAFRLLEESVEQHGGDDDDADDDLLDEGGHAEQVEAVAEDAHDERADERADDGIITQKTWEKWWAITMARITTPSANARD